MGQIILANAVQREAGYLYYINMSGDLCRVEMKNGGRRKDESEKKED